MAYKKKIHKVKKDEEMADIAKKYKHKDWKNIWQAPENKKLVSKRKKPDQIEPGDVLTIPFNAAQWAEITNEVTDWQAILAADTNLTASFEARRAKSEIAIQTLKGTIASSDKLHKEIVGNMKKAADGAKRWGSAVDAISTVTQLMFNLGKLVKAGHKGAKLAGKELAKLNAQLSKDVLDMAYAPIAKEARKAAAKHVKNETNGYSFALGALGELSDSFDKMTSPSFWAWTAARLHEGDSWSDAVTYDFQKEVKNNIAKQTRYEVSHQKKLHKSIAAQEALIGDISKERKNALGRMSNAEKKLKELEKLF